MTTSATHSSQRSTSELTPALQERAVMPPSRAAVQFTLNSWNEFGRLREIVVGSALGANHPAIDNSFENFFTPPNDDDIRARAHGKIPQAIIAEIEEDLELLIKTLQSFGVNVLRPTAYDSTTPIKTPLWESEQLYSLMPRDCLFVHGDLILEVPSPTRARLFETYPFRDIALAYQQHPERPGLFLAAPKPLLCDEAFKLEIASFLPNNEILFDGANCVRLGSDIFMDINNSANMLGLNWLQGLFDRLHSGVTVHPMHIGEDHADVTLVPLRPGVILVDEKRVNSSNLPAQFKNWTQVRVGELAHQSYGLPYPMASNGIGRNVLMIDENTAIVEENQRDLISKLEALKFTVKPLRYRHGRTLGGAFHCVTLDTHREGDLVSYF